MTPFQIHLALTDSFHLECLTLQDWIIRLRWEILYEASVALFLAAVKQKAFIVISHSLLITQENLIRQVGLHFFTAVN